MNPKRIVIAGGSGFIGSALAKDFSARHFAVVILTRTPRARADNVREIEWDGKHIGEWISHLDGAEALFNLTGKNINCPHTPKNLRAITASRVESIYALGDALAHIKTPPRVWVQASAIGYYGDTGSQICDEHMRSGHDALADICRQWEAAFESVNAPRTRKVALRIGFVLGRNGGALPVLHRLARWYLGGAIGRGRQYISWIHLADLVRMFEFLMSREMLPGIFNAVAPNPVTNKEFMRELRRVLRRPWSPPAPKFAVRLGARLMHSDASLAIISQRCIPTFFHELEFSWQFPKLRGALENLCGKK